MKRNEITTTKQQSKNLLKVNKTELEVKMIGFVKLLNIMSHQNIICHRDLQNLFLYFLGIEMNSWGRYLNPSHLSSP